MGVGAWLLARVVAHGQGAARLRRNFTEPLRELGFLTARDWAVVWRLDLELARARRGALHGALPERPDRRGSG